MGLFFVYFQSFQTNITNFYNKYMWKMSIQYTVPGFEPTTFQTWVVTHNHQTSATKVCTIKQVNEEPMCFLIGRPRPLIRLFSVFFKQENK